MSLIFEGICHDFAEGRALDGISFAAAPGDVTCLLGPSGCGKTTLLRLAAGIMPVQQGSITLNAILLADATHHTAPEHRSVGLVFQEGALFPHLTVRQNISFGIRTQKSCRQTVDGLLETIGLANFAERYPHTLSGGQQQRVALARALAPAPRIVLLDEPFANVDIVRRRALREETRHILKARNTVVILVTHDPEEALEIADKIVVLTQGRVIQDGTPEQLYDHPKSLAVGKLIGNGQHVQARWHDNILHTPFGAWPATCLVHPPPTRTNALDLLIRPEAMQITEDTMSTKIVDTRITGPHRYISVAAPTGETLSILTNRDTTSTVGDNVSLHPKPSSLHAFASGISA